MKFVIDAQLPRRLALRLSELGHQAVHTIELENGNKTPDLVICRHADSIGAVVVTKDADFAISRALAGTPQRLLVIATGNISNMQSLAMIETNLAAIEAALVLPARVELTCTTLFVHD